MPDLLVVVLEVRASDVRAVLAEVDRPGAALREERWDRGPDLAADVVALLQRLAVSRCAQRLLALAVAADESVAGRTGLVAQLGPELPEGWGLPATLPVVTGTAGAWSRTGAAAAGDPLVAGAVLAAARALGAHAHLPRPSR